VLAVYTMLLRKNLAPVQVKVEEKFMNNVEAFQQRKAKLQKYRDDGFLATYNDIKQVS
jgi:hypothetical protein